MPEGLASGVLDRLLTFIDRPWKVFAIAFLFVIGGFGFVLYQQRTTIVQIVLRGYVTPHLTISRFTEIAPSLLKATGADMIELMTVDMEANLATPVASLGRDGQPWKVSPLPRSVIDISSNIATVVDFIEGQPSCANLSINDAVPQRRDEATLGIQRMCVIAVPPVMGVLVGAMFVGWKQPLEPNNEAAASQILRGEAMRLATW
jgi:hypothetical protein